LAQALVVQAPARFPQPNMTKNSLMAHFSCLCCMIVVSLAGLVNANWSLNDPKGPWCDDSQVSARQAWSVTGNEPGPFKPTHESYGWDPCCLWDQTGTLKCSMGPNDKKWGFPVWDPVGPTGKGTWCWNYDYERNGNTCKNPNNQRGNGWDYWTGGFVYDKCDDRGVQGYNQQCIHTGNDGSASLNYADGKDWWPDGGWIGAEEMANKCWLEAKPTCVLGYVHGLDPDHREQRHCTDPYSLWRVNNTGVQVCWPTPTGATTDTEVLI